MGGEKKKDKKNDDDDGVRNPLNAPSGGGGGADEAQSDRRSALSDRRSARRSAAASENSQSSATRSEVKSSLSQLADLNLNIKNKFVLAWLHSKVSMRLTLMLMIPFIALIVLLVLGITSQTSRNQTASDILELSTLVGDVLKIVYQFSVEETDCLWWSLDRTLKSGIEFNHGGVTSKGLNNSFQLSNVAIDNFNKRLKAVQYVKISARLSHLLSAAQDQMMLVYDFRYAVQKWEKTPDEVMSYYETQVNQFARINEFIGVLADVSTIPLCQSLVTWSQLRVAYMRERQILGSLIITKKFTTELHTNWKREIALQSVLQERFVTISPQEMRDHGNQFFVSDVIRTVEELRKAAIETYIPNNTLSIPNMTFFEWWDPASVAITQIGDYRVYIQNLINQVAKEDQTNAQTSLSLYIVLAVLCGAFSILMAVLVTWSVEKPWNALVAMKNNMMTKLAEQDKLNTIVDMFVPHDFLNMMGVKSLYELQLGNCMLKRATLVIAEIRNFTTLSERMAPHQNFQFLNGWLLDSGPLVRRHGGFIDKFHGHRIVAIFQDPNDAVDSALELLESAARRNQDETMSSLQIELGVAVHTGDIMLGTLGEEERMETAIISEALQVAMQACNMCTLFTANMVVTRETYMLLNIEGLSVRFMGEMGIHGLHLHLQLYELLLPTEEAKLETLNDFNQAMKSHQALEYEDAVRNYDAVLEANPNDILAQRRRKLAANNEWVDVISGK